MTQRKVEKLSPLNEDKVNVLPVVDASNTINEKKDKRKRPGLYAENVPTFYCGIGNNSDMVTSFLKKLGWDQITEPTNEDFRMKWVQSTRAINWNSFREGEQMVNHIPNCNLFTNKLNLLCTLQAYEKNQMAAANKHTHFMPLEDYLPLTYKLDDRVDKETYFATAKNDELWICKPVSLNQGKGIYLVRNPETLRQKLDAFDDGQQQKKFGGNKPIGRVIQKYIDNPLLVNKKKFDIRCYMTIASTKPILALFCHGYLRLTIQDFVHDDNNLLTHLTNQFLQKKDERYKDEKDQTTMSMEDFNTYINENVAPEKGLPQDWVLNDLTKKMRQIMLQVIHGIRYKMQRKVGYFGIYGYDFMIDDNMKVWLIEVNVNPAITTNTEVLSKVIPPVIEEGINISVECFEKSKANKRLLPLSSIKKYIILYNESQVPCKKPRFDRSPSHIKQNNSNTTAPQANNNNNNNNNNDKAKNGQTNNQNSTSNNNNNIKIQVNKATNSSSSMSNPNVNNSTNNCNIVSTSTSNVNRSNNLTTSSNNIAKSAELANAPRTKNDLSQQRNALSSSLLNKPLPKQLPKSPQDFLPRASDVTRLAEIGTRAAKPVTAYQFANSSSTVMNASPTVGFKTPLKTNVTSLSLKPATVEVYFRSNSGKAQKVENNRKSIPTTIFPPPKIGLKS